MLQGKKIILGVCGSIAAYKAALLVRLLVKEQAEVKVVMTSSACSFITPLTLSTLSKNPVYTQLISSDGTWTNHVDLALWADLIIIAPCSAHTLSKMANGICDNLLLSVYLSARCPVFIAPAMDVDMFVHPSTQKNIHALTVYGNKILEPEVGELASGLSGQGRMMEPENILVAIADTFLSGQTLSGKKVLITAGPTYEAIDPVRFIGNHASGKMGFELAKVASEAGAEVTLITGPTQLAASGNIREIKVVSAGEMREVVLEHFAVQDIIIMAAAVADYTPKSIASQKIKKSDSDLTIELKRTVDIAKEVGAKKSNHQILIGFALETEDEMENAKKKIATKNLDYIVLNSLNDPGAGFGNDTNKITIIDKSLAEYHFDLKSKSEVARDIFKVIEKSVIEKRR